ncbi:hypothetical protein Y032_0095g2823 [Ancylostoma ceylanicum]|uniref:Lysozyme n=1 Tax=Ancylostoma ceylanicum TaxID=53326 RepID=A0A016TKV0_9BILA|nr:hypothetical protein Y032_0095g2823 [Ancylostoma ceylanicum]
MTNILFPLAFFSLIHVVNSQPKGNFAFALDISSPLNLAGAQCFRTNHYPTVFLRVFSPYDSGSYENNVCNSIRNAKRAGLEVEVFMTPDVMSQDRNGAVQFDKLYTSLKSCNVYIRSVWLQVTSPINWPDKQRENIAFIEQIIARANNYRVAIGIYTNFYDWKQITGGSTAVDGVKMLWYWNVRNIGPLGETPSNFDDFRAFGPWRSAVVKQFGQVEEVCGYITNRNIYIPSKIYIGNSVQNRNFSTIGGIGLE